MPRPRVAIFDFAGCEGCQLQIVNLEEALLDLLRVVDVVEWREAMSEQSDVFDIAVVEGAITRLEDEERLKRIRQKAPVLVALGSCASSGGLNKLKNRMAMSEARRLVYGRDGGVSRLDTAPVKAVSEVVKVDYLVRGCPIDRREFSYVVRCLALGREPFIPGYPVCVECRIRENACRWQEGEICLGPLTRAGCGAACPAQGAACLGCRGTCDDANLEGMASVLAQYGKSREELESRLAVFLDPDGKGVSHA